jgi:hypothetical protein
MQMQTDDPGRLASPLTEQLGRVPKLGTVDRAEWLADKLHNGGDYGKEAAALLVEQAHQIESLRDELRIEKQWGELWYFVSDEAPLEFERIVSEWTPGRWIGEAHKLMKAKRGA